MLQSQLFTKTRREAPKDEFAESAKLLIRGGFIHKEMAGVYDYLPLGLKVLKKIEDIVREEMNAIGGQEILMTTLQGAEIWKKTGRWDDKKVDNWFKTTLKSGNEIGIANTHEEPITAMLAQFVDSYRDLPLYVYQFQTKFRNELRAKSGIMRTREFIMKDLYSFSRSEQEFAKFYNKAAEAYEKIFNRVGIGHLTFRTLATGGSFSAISDEFQTITESGEDIIYVNREKRISVNKEFLESKLPGLDRLGLDKMDRSKLEEVRSVEVGNIFPLGTEFSEKLGLTFTDPEGQKKPVIMGSYGIGLGRLLGAIAEVHHDEKGIIWPRSVAPFDVHLVALDANDTAVSKEAKNTYQALQAAGITVLFDDRDLSAGAKFADGDLLGMPLRLVISRRSLARWQIELKKRDAATSEYISTKALIPEVLRAFA